MKSLLLLPLIAVIAVNGLYFPENGKEQLELDLRNNVNTTTAQPSGDCESNGGECKKNKKQCKDTISTEITCSKNGVCCIVEGKAQSASELMLQMLTNTILIQGMAVQTLKEDQENSMRNLTNAMANLKMAGEIKMSNLSDALSAAISDQGIALQGNLSDTISNQGMAILSNQDSIMSNLSNGFSNEENMLESMEDNQDIMMSNLTRLGCPEGMFMLSPSGECFKFFNDQTRSWYTARTKCQAEGLVMAQPSDPVTLLKYIVNNYGNSYSYSWLNAKGTGSSTYRWYPYGGYITSSNSYWWSTSLSSGVFSTGNCLLLGHYDSWMKSHPGKAYIYAGCSSSSSYYTICELVKE